MTETELTIIDNIVNQTITDIATGFTLEYFDYSQGKLTHAVSNELS